MLLQINKIIDNRIFLKTKYLIIISCNKKSFAKDYMILKNKYHIIKNLETLNIRNTYFLIIESIINFFIAFMMNSSKI